MKKDLFYEEMNILSNNFPVIFHYDHFSRDDETKPAYLNRHWHEKIELLYIDKGNGTIICSTREYKVKPGDLIVINSNEIHEGYPSQIGLKYYCIIIDNLLFSSLYEDLSESKYIKPIYENKIVFQNKISNDKAIQSCLQNIIYEYENNLTGFELAVRGYLFNLVINLIRKYTIKKPSEDDFHIKTDNINTINSIIDYLNKNYRNKITINTLATKFNLSKYYLVHLFKDITGRTIISYVNFLRIKKADSLLSEGKYNISEISNLCGFRDPNYFSRIYKKHKGISPSEYISKFSK